MDQLDGVYIHSLVKKHSNKDFFENKLFTQKTRMDIHGKIKNRKSSYGCDWWFWRW